MHNRRVAAAIIGAWLMGSVLMWVTLRQSKGNVERTLNSVETLATGSVQARQDSRRVFERGALLLNHRLARMWEIVQLALGGTLVASSLLTVHRSRLVAPSAIAMTAIVVVQTFLVAPAIRDLELQSIGGAASDTDFQYLGLFYGTHQILQAIKILLGVAIGVRVIVNWHTWRHATASGEPSQAGEKRMKRRRRA